MLNPVRLLIIRVVAALLSLAFLLLRLAADSQPLRTARRTADIGDDRRSARSAPMPYAEVNNICMDFEEYTGGEP